MLDTEMGHNPLNLVVAFQHTLLSTHPEAIMSWDINQSKFVFYTRFFKVTVLSLSHNWFPHDQPTCLSPSHTAR